MVAVRLFAGLILGGILSLPRAAMATPSYTAVFLPSGGNTSTYADGIENGQIVGYSYAPVFHALVWNSPYSQPIDLNPSGDINSQAGSTDGNYQVGRALTAAGINTAVVWQGSAASVITLAPPAGFTDAAAGNMVNGQIAGGGTAADGSEHAVLWNGINSIGIDINPSGYGQSAVRATNGQEQIGYGVPTGQNEQVPLLWNGTADSAVDISPAGYADSRAYAISGSLVAGYGAPAAGQSDALLWNISDGTVTDLGLGVADAIAGNYEAGYRFEGVDHAMVWNGSAVSAIDLNAYLPSDLQNAFCDAFGVDQYGDVVGEADTPSGAQAVLWIVPEPVTPSCFVLGLLLLPRCRKNHR